jgi:hypothetical protein
MPKKKKRRKKTLVGSTPGSRYQYKVGGLTISTFPGPRYQYVLGIFISTKKWPGTGPHYQYIVEIMMYVQINFVPIVNHTRGVSLSVLYR